MNPAGGAMKKGTREGQKIVDLEATWWPALYKPQESIFSNYMDAYNFISRQIDLSYDHLIECLYDNEAALVRQALLEQLG